MFQNTRIKKFIVFIIALNLLFINKGFGQCDDLYLAGLLDGPLPGGIPKMVQVCANKDIPDLSIFGLGSANNGSGSDGIEYTFPSISLDSSFCFTVASETTGFNSFFGCDPDATSSAVNVNGNDAIELFCNGNLSDLYGDQNINGSGENWDYEDGWAVSLDSMPNTTFAAGQWNISGPNVLDGETSNASANIPYPLNICIDECRIDSLQVLSQSPCNHNDNTYSQSLNIFYTNTPASGTLNINGFSFAITGSPQLVNLTGLPSNGLAVDIMVAFSDDTSCNFTEQNAFVAPLSCNGGNMNGSILDTITILTYNILNFPNPSNSNSLGSDAARVVYFRNVIDSTNADIIILQELKSLNGMVILTNELNSNSTNETTYDYAPIWTGYGGLGNGVIFNTQISTLMSFNELPRNNSMMAPNGNSIISPRANTVYQFEITNSVCSDVSNLDLISVHLKAGSDNEGGNEIADRDNRNLGVLDALDFTSLQSATSNIIVGGDFNFRSDDITSGNNSEPGYVNLVDSNNTPSFSDPLNGFTRNITSDAFKYTQATRNGNINAYGNGGIPGGLDDRFDFLFISESLLNNTNQVEYISQSYLTPGSPGILNSESCASGLSNCLDYEYMSDHFPVLIKLSVEFENCIEECPTELIVNSDFINSEVDTLNAAQNIVADNSIGATSEITYQAGQEIELLPGFEVILNAFFEAIIGPCPN